MDTAVSKNYNFHYYYPKLLPCSNTSTKHEPLEHQTIEVE